MYQQYFGEAKSAIAYLSSDELKELLNDDEKLEERVNEVLKNLNDEKQVIITQNRGIAEENVNKEPEIIERKSRISELSDQGKALCTRIQELLTEIKSKKGDKTPDTALALLQAATAEAEEKSDEIARKFQEKEIPIDEYLEQFMAARKLMHIRKLKTEKMTELMRKQTQNMPGPNPPMGHPQPFAGYPAGPFYPRGMQPYPPMPMQPMHPYPPF